MDQLFLLLLYTNSIYLEFSNLSCLNIKIFSHVAFQAKKPALNKTQGFQIMLVGDASNLSLDKEQRDLIEKFPHFEFNQIILFTISLQIAYPCNLLEKASTPSSSWSWIYLVTMGFQHPPSPSYSHPLISHASLAMAIENNKGKQPTSKGSHSH